MRLAVTRDFDHLTELVAEAKSREIELVPLPLTSIEPVSFTWPPNSCSRVDWLVFTSAHGVHVFFDGIRNAGKGLDRLTKIAVVGSKTAAAVVRYGYSVDFVPSNSYGETLFGELIECHLKRGNTLVYVRAEEVVSDPSGTLRSHGVDYHEIVCYRSVPVKCDRNSVMQLDGQDCILFTAPSKVATYNSQFGKPRARVIAIGATTAREMRKLGWSNIDVLSTADISCIWEQF